jgi:hypothetical protein
VWNVIVNAFANCYTNLNQILFRSTLASWLVLCCCWEQKIILRQKNTKTLSMYFLGWRKFLTINWKSDGCLIKKNWESRALINIVYAN